MDDVIVNSGTSLSAAEPLSARAVPSDPGVSRVSWSRAPDSAPLRNPVLTSNDPETNMKVYDAEHSKGAESEEESAPDYPFFDLDLKGHQGRYVFQSYEPTISPERHGMPDGPAYAGPRLLFPDPRTEIAPDLGDMSKRHIYFQKTYRHMLLRSIERQRNGEYSATSMSNTMWKILFLFITAIFLVIAIYRIVFQSVGTVSSRAAISIDQWVFYFAFIVCLPWLLSGNTSEFVKAVLLTVDVWFLAVFILTVSYVAVGTDPQRAREEPAFLAIFWVLTAIAGATAFGLLVLELVLFRLTPTLLRWNLISDNATIALWDIKPVPERAWTFSYRAFLDITHRSTFSYRGALDEHGRPHGQGEWLDDGLRGETLAGLFVDGIPVAPFISAVPSTGSSFTAMRIGFIRNNKAAWNSGNFHPTRDEKGLSIGVAQVEVSIAGKFLKHLPTSSLITGPEYITDKGATERMMHALTHSPNDPMVDEAVLYIHGLWNSAETALASISQFRALSAYPTKIKFFVFDWPGGWYPFSTFGEVRRMSRSEGVKQDLKETVKLLGSMGFRKLHIIGHSMGCRVACHLTEFMDQLFRPLPESPLAQRQPPSSFSNLPELCSLTLIHGELDLVDFLNIKFPILKQYTRLLTSYTDSHDKALQLAELFTGRLSMGRNPGAYFIDPFAATATGGFDFAGHCRKEFEEVVRYAPATTTFKRRAAGLVANELEASQSPADGAIELELTGLTRQLGVPNSFAVPIEQPGRETGGPHASEPSILPTLPKFGNNAHLRKSLTLPSPRVKAWLDMDVIDSSFLDSNADLARHSLFVFNRLLLDDIHEIITGRRRAMERQGRLLRRQGNSFYFLCAPSFVRAS